MKSTFLAILFFTIAFSSYSMTISQRVRHLADIPSTASGCSQVSLKVIYNTGVGMNYIAVSSTVTINSGSFSDLSVVIPDGATVVSKTVHFSFVGGNSYSYLITNSNNSITNAYQNCSCPPIASKYLFLAETTGKMAELQFYHTSVVGGAC